MTEIIKGDNGNVIMVDGKPYAAILSIDGATDSFERIEDGAWRWHRHTDVPVDNMRILGEPDTFDYEEYKKNGFKMEHLGDYPLKLEKKPEA